MAQPKMGLIRWMLGRTFYPDNTYTRDREGNPIRPYDMATDIFSEFMGVRCDPLPDPITQGLTKVTAPAWPAGTVAANAAERLRDQHEAERRLPGGQPAARQGRDGSPRARRATASRRETSSSPARRPRLAAEVAKQTGVDFAALSSAVPAVRLPAAQAAHRDVSALRRRQHGRGLVAADVRAVRASR